MTHAIALPPPSTVPELALAKWVRSLFLNSEQGAWYDPSDMSTLFQDAAGTVPVTAVEQPVGRILDKSGRGNHATQTTAASRPVLSALYNLLPTNTNAFEWAESTAVGPSSTLRYRQPNAALAPDGTQTATKLSGSTGVTTQRIYAVVPLFNSLNAPTTYSIYAKAAEYTRVGIKTTNNASADLIVDLTTGSILQAGNSTSQSVIDVGNGWWCISFTFTPTINPVFWVTLISPSSLTNFFAGDGTSGIFLWGAQVVVTDSLPGNRYQRVNTSSDYDTVGFRPYLRFDGVDDFLVTPSIDFASTDKMTVFAGVRKLSDATTGMLVELSAASSNTNPGSFFILGNAITSKYQARSCGTVAPLIETAATYAAPVTHSLTLVGDIPGDLGALRINGTQAATSTADQGTGTYGNYPLYIGRRGGTSLPFNGHLYQLIIRGAQSSDAQIRAAEAWVNDRTGAY